MPALGLSAFSKIRFPNKKENVMKAVTRLFYSKVSATRKFSCLPRLFFLSKTTALLINNKEALSYEKWASAALSDLLQSTRLVL